ncbi:MAG: hypothetical protein ACKOYP_11695, partial [Bacteroidota bacterium]
ESNKVVWSKTITTRKGFNQYRWDYMLRLHSSPLPYFTGAQEFVKPGRYKLRIEGVTPATEVNLTIED